VLSAYPMIDTHVHFWDAKTLATYEWITDKMEALRRPFGPADLHPHLATHGVEGVLAVQTCPSLKETEQLIAIAADAEIVVGVIGWVNLTAPNVREVVTELRGGAAGRYLVGIRHQVHDEPDQDWLGRADVRRGLRAVQDAGLAFDLLIGPRELPAALAVSRALPDLQFIVDHGAKPPIASGKLEPWASQIAPISRLENVACKVSGLVTEASWHDWQVDDILQYTSRLIDWFGEGRLLFGSDWPVCLLAGGYGEVLDAYDKALGGLTRISANADSIYRLPDPQQE
jgi:L-fuconolactonase